MSVMSQQKMRKQQTRKQGEKMLKNQKLHSDQELQRVQDLFLNDFFNEKSSKKKQICFIPEDRLKQVREQTRKPDESEGSQSPKLTLEQAKILMPKLFTKQKNFKFINKQLEPIAKLQQTGFASDCFEISQKPAPLVRPAMEAVTLKPMVAKDEEVLRKLGQEYNSFENELNMLKRKQEERRVQEVKVRKVKVRLRILEMV